MERIGIAASKIAKGNFYLYNFFVVLISFLFSIFIFLVGGSAVLIALILLGYFFKGSMSANFEKEWISVMLICMIALAISVGLFCLVAIARNIKFNK